METQTEGTTTDRRKVVIIVAVIAVVIIALVIFLLTRSDSKKTASVGDTPTTTVAPTTTAANTRTLPPLSFILLSSGTSAGYSVSGSTCSGSGSFAGASGGGAVIVRNAANEELARTTVSDGVVSPKGCTFTTVGPVTVPKADSYVIQFPGIKATPPLSFAEIEEFTASGEPLFGVKNG